MTDIENYTIMVIDDSEFSRNTISSILRENGFNVTAEASSADEALKILSRNPCNLYIIDVVMPETSGLDLAKIIKESSTHAHILMISSLNEEEIIMDAIANGAQDFIQKPFGPSDLINSVSQMYQSKTKTKDSLLK